MKNTVTFLIPLIVTTAAFGQKFSIGSEVGIISSINTHYEITDMQNRRNTYYSGINFNYKCDNRVTFSTGFHYLRQGYRHPTCYFFEEGVKNQLVGKIDYLAIPITANIHLLKSRKLITSLGLLGAYNIKAVQDYPKPIGGCFIYYIPDLTDITRDHSIVGIIGLGYKIFENDKFELVSNIKYYQGLTNIYTWMRMTGEYSSALLTINFNYKL